MNIKKRYIFQVVVLTVMAVVGSRAGLAQSQSPQPSLSQLTTPLSGIILAGGCFWCMEPPFEKLPGVIEVVAGYSGGSEVNPTYEQVSAGKTGHREVVLIKFDKNKISLEKIMEVFWRSFDPTDAGGQFVDRGFQYSSAVYVKDETDRQIAEKSRQQLIDSKKFSKPIVTPIESTQNFYRAEDYHQDYYKKNPIRYRYYRSGSGRDSFLKSTWGDSK